MVEARLGGAAPILGTPVSGDGHQQRVRPLRWRRCRATSSPSRPGMAMSSKTTSGLSAAAASRAVATVVGHLHLMILALQHTGQAGGRVDVVVDHQDATSGRHAGGGGGATAPPEGRPAAAASDWERGRRTTNSLPFPSPALWAFTRPPCNSTRRLTRVSPSPSPGDHPADRPAGRTDRTPDPAGRRRFRFRCRSPRARSAIAVLAQGQPDVSANRGCTWRRC